MYYSWLFYWTFSCKTNNRNTALCGFPNILFLTFKPETTAFDQRKANRSTFQLASLYFPTRSDLNERDSPTPLPSLYLTILHQFLPKFHRFCFIPLATEAPTPSVSFIITTKLHGCREILPPSTQHPHTPFIRVFAILHQILFFSPDKYNLFSLPSSVASAPQ